MGSFLIGLRTVHWLLEILRSSQTEQSLLLQILAKGTPFGHPALSHTCELQQDKQPR
jgi:hypothetical protein